MIRCLDDLFIFSSSFPFTFWMLLDVPTKCFRLCRKNQNLIMLNTILILWNTIFQIVFPPINKIPNQIQPETIRGTNLQVKAFFLSSLRTPRMRPFFNWQSIWSLVVMEGNLVIYLLFCYRASLFWIPTEKRTTLIAFKTEQRRENTALIMHLAPNVPTRYVGLMLCVWSLWY